MVSLAKQLPTTGGRLMSEAYDSTPSKNASVAPTDSSDSGMKGEQQGAGAMLRSAREARGLHIAALAVLLKVPVKKMEALESDRLDLLPDAVFVRALASSVCRTLKIDAAPILARLPETIAPTLTYQGAGINQPFRSPGDGPGPSVWAQVSRPAVLAGMLLMMGALVLIFLPAIKTGIGEVALATSEFKVKDAATETAMLAAAVTESGSADSSRTAVISDASLPTNGSGVPSSEPISAGTPATVAVLGAAVPTVTAAAPPTNSASPNDVVVFTAKTESWVEATDATGQVVLRRTLSAGEVIGASGALPLKIVVGRADATQVQIRGKLFDVNSVAKDNVARFEVK